MLKDTPKALFRKRHKNSALKSKLKFSTQRASCKKIAKHEQAKPQANANYKKAKAQIKLKPQASPKNHQK